MATEIEEWNSSNFSYGGQNIHCTEDSSQLQRSEVHQWLKAGSTKLIRKFQKCLSGTKPRWTKPVLIQSIERSNKDQSTYIEPRMLLECASTPLINRKKQLGPRQLWSSGDAGTGSNLRTSLGASTASKTGPYSVFKSYRPSKVRITVLGNSNRTSRGQDTTQTTKTSRLTLILWWRGNLGKARAVSDETFPESWLTNDDGMLDCDG